MALDPNTWTLVRRSKTTILGEKKSIKQKSMRNVRGIRVCIYVSTETSNTRDYYGKLNLKRGRNL